MRALTGTASARRAPADPERGGDVALATPMARLVYERGEFDAESTARTARRVWLLAPSLPFSGLNLLFTRTFSRSSGPGRHQVASRRWRVKVVSVALYEPLGIAGIVPARPCPTW